jgi:hypothetical protein
LTPLINAGVTLSIFKFEGGEAIGVFSIASSIGLPKVARGASGAIAAASAALDKNDLLEVEFDIS